MVDLLFFFKDWGFSFLPLHFSTELLPSLEVSRDVMRDASDQLVSRPCDEI